MKSKIKKALYILLSLTLVWNTVPHLVLLSLDVPSEVKSKASLNFIDAAWRGMIDTPVGFTAPIVVPIALLFTKWEDERLPSAFRAFDNDINLNGDPRGFDGRLLMPVTLEKEGPLADEAKAGCYWSEGNHPRSFWARYVWIGWRNRASRLGMMLGKDFENLPMKVYGDPQTENGHEGWKLVERGSNVRLYIIKKWGPFAYRFNWGFKVEQNRGGKIMPVNISFSLKGWDEK